MSTATEPIPESAEGKIPPALLSSRWKARAWNFGWTCSAAAPLLVARMLTPSERGVGTHQQLGLPPCTFLWATGFPCPFCGMTTSWALAAHYEIARSIHTQPAGFALFVVCAAFVPILLALAITGRIAFRPEQVLARVSPRGWYAIFALLALAWGWKIALVRGWIT